MKNYIKKMWDLEIFVLVSKMEGYFGPRKFLKNTQRISPEIIDSLEDFDLNPYNFLIIDLNKSGLVCLDIDNHGSSLEEFYAFLDKHNTKKEELLMEKTMNNGLHIYFKNSLKTLKESHWNSMNNIHFDFLTRRSFSAPSSFKNKKYEWIGDNFENLRNKNDIPDIPEFVLELLNANTKYLGKRG